MLVDVKSLDGSNAKRLLMAGSCVPAVMFNVPASSPGGVGTVRSPDCGLEEGGVELVEVKDGLTSGLEQ